MKVQLQYASPCTVEKPLVKSIRISWPGSILKIPKYFFGQTFDPAPELMMIFFHAQDTQELCGSLGSIYPVIITLGLQLDNYLFIPYKGMIGYNYGVGRFIF